MKHRTGGGQGSWVTLLVVGSLLTGCAGGSAGAGKGADNSPSRSAGSPSHGGSPGTGASPSSGSGTASVFTPDAALVPRTSADGQRLADSVVLAPGDWGRGFVAQSPASSAPGTWAVLDGRCRWEREKLPHGVLASVSRYSRLPGDKDKGPVKVTAAATVHASVLSADDQLSTTLEEVLRCPEQQPRSDEKIMGLRSLSVSQQQYADDSVLEDGKFVARSGETQPYRWMVARLGTVVVAVSVTGGKGHTQQELSQLGDNALAQLLLRVQQRLKGK